MGARSGNNYLSALRRLKADLWLDGERIADPTIHPALVKQARALASLYDLQAEHPAAMTYRLDDGARAGFSFVQAARAEEVQQRGAMFRRWAAQTHGALLTPDRHNSMLAAIAAGAQSFADNNPRFAENLRSYYTQARAHDWCAALSRAPAASERAPEAPLVIDETPDGLIIKGCQPIDALGPFAEELFNLPITGAPAPALVFAINCNASGLRLECRRAAQSGDELICSAIFDQVLIPSSRIFFRGDHARWGALFDTSDALVAMLHHEAVQALALAESILQSVAQRPDASDLAYAITSEIETIRTAVLAAESNAHRGRSGQFVLAPEPLEEAVRRSVAVERRWSEMTPA
jgi:4-hydroxyphenylacetate 3-monooxygenase